MVNFQQSQAALTSHIESFWSIVPHRVNVKMLKYVVNLTSFIGERFYLKLKVEN